MKDFRFFDCALLNISRPTKPISSMNLPTRNSPPRQLFPPDHSIIDSRHDITEQHSVETFQGHGQNMRHSINTTINIDQRRLSKDHMGSQIARTVGTISNTTIQRQPTDEKTAAVFSVNTNANNERNMKGTENLAGSTNEGRRVVVSTFNISRVDGNALSSQTDNTARITMIDIQGKTRTASNSDNVAESQLNDVNNIKTSSSETNIEVGTKHINDNAIRNVDTISNAVMNISGGGVNAQTGSFSTSNVNVNVAKATLSDSNKARLSRQNNNGGTELVSNTHLGTVDENATHYSKTLAGQRSDRNRNITIERTDNVRLFQGNNSVGTVTGINSNSSTAYYDDSYYYYNDTGTSNETYLYYDDNYNDTYTNIAGNNRSENSGNISENNTLWSAVVNKEMNNGTTALNMTSNSVTNVNVNVEIMRRTKIDNTNELISGKSTNTYSNVSTNLNSVDFNNRSHVSVNDSLIKETITSNETDILTKTNIYNAEVSNTKGTFGSSDMNADAISQQIVHVPNKIIVLPKYKTINNSRQFSVEGDSNTFSVENELLKRNSELTKARNSTVYSTLTSLNSSSDTRHPHSSLSKTTEESAMMDVSSNIVHDTVGWKDIAIKEERMLIDNNTNDSKFNLVDSSNTLDPPGVPMVDTNVSNSFEEVTTYFYPNNASTDSSPSTRRLFYRVSAADRRPNYAALDTLQSASSLIRNNLNAGVSVDSFSSLTDTIKSQNTGFDNTEVVNNALRTSSFSENMNIGRSTEDSGKSSPVSVVNNIDLTSNNGTSVFSKRLSTKTISGGTSDTNVLMGRTENLSPGQSDTVASSNVVYTENIQERVSNMLGTSEGAYPEMSSGGHIVTSNIIRPVSSDIIRDNTKKTRDISFEQANTNKRISSAERTAFPARVYTDIQNVFTTKTLTDKPHVTINSKQLHERNTFGQEQKTSINDNTVSKNNFIGMPRWTDSSNTGFDKISTPTLKPLPSFSTNTMPPIFESVTTTSRYRKLDMSTRAYDHYIGIVSTTEHPLDRVDSTFVKMVNYSEITSDSIIPAPNQDISPVYDISSSGKPTHSESGLMSVFSSTPSSPATENYHKGTKSTSSREYTVVDDKTLFTNTNFFADSDTQVDKLGGVPVQSNPSAINNSMSTKVDNQHLSSVASTSHSKFRPYTNLDITNTLDQGYSSEGIYQNAMVTNLKSPIAGYAIPIGNADSDTETSFDKGGNYSRYDARQVDNFTIATPDAEIPVSLGKMITDRILTNDNVRQNDSTNSKDGRTIVWQSMHLSNLTNADKHGPLTTITRSDKSADIETFTTLTSTNSGNINPSTLLTITDNTDSNMLTSLANTGNTNSNRISFTNTDNADSNRISFTNTGNTDSNRLTSFTNTGNTDSNKITSLTNTSTADIYRLLSLTSTGNTDSNRIVLFTNTGNTDNRDISFINNDNAGSNRITPFTTADNADSNRIASLTKTGSADLISSFIKTANTDSNRLMSIIKGDNADSNREASFTNTGNAEVNRFSSLTKTGNSQGNRMTSFPNTVYADNNISILHTNSGNADSNKITTFTNTGTKRVSIQTGDVPSNRVIDSAKNLDIMMKGNAENVPSTTIQSDKNYDISINGNAKINKIPTTKKTERKSINTRLGNVPAVMPPIKVKTTGNGVANKFFNDLKESKLSAGRIPLAPRRNISLFTPYSFTLDNNKRLPFSEMTERQSERSNAQANNFIFSKTISGLSNPLEAKTVSNDLSMSAIWDINRGNVDTKEQMANSKPVPVLPITDNANRYILYSVDKQDANTMDSKVIGQTSSETVKSVNIRNDINSKTETDNKSQTDVNKQVLRTLEALMLELGTIDTKVSQRDTPTMTSSVYRDTVDSTLRREEYPLFTVHQRLPALPNEIRTWRHKQRSREGLRGSENHILLNTLGMSNQRDWNPDINVNTDINTGTLPNSSDGRMSEQAVVHISGKRSKNSDLFAKLSNSFANISLGSRLQKTDKGKQKRIAKTIVQDTETKIVDHTANNSDTQTDSLNVPFESSANRTLSKKQTIIHPKDSTFFNPFTGQNIILPRLGNRFTDKFIARGIGNLQHMKAVEGLRSAGFLPNLTIHHYNFTPSVKSGGAISIDGKYFQGQMRRNEMGQFEPIPLASRFDAKSAEKRLSLESSIVDNVREVANNRNNNVETAKTLSILKAINNGHVNGEMGLNRVTGKTSLVKAVPSGIDPLTSWKLFDITSNKQNETKDNVGLLETRSLQNADGNTDQRPVPAKYFYSQNDLLKTNGIALNTAPSQLANSLSGVNEQSTNANLMDKSQSCKVGEMFVCNAVGENHFIPGMVWWCFSHCKNGVCPREKCTCRCEKIREVPTVKNTKLLRNANIAGTKRREKVIQLTLNEPKKDSVTVSQTTSKQLDNTITLKTNSRPLNLNSTVNNIGQTMNSTVKRSETKTLPLTCKGINAFADTTGIEELCTKVCSKNICPETICMCL